MNMTAPESYAMPFWKMNFVVKGTLRVNHAEDNNSSTLNNSVDPRHIICSSLLPPAMPKSGLEDEKATAVSSLCFDPVQLNPGRVVANSVADNIWHVSLDSFACVELQTE